MSQHFSLTWLRITNSSLHLCHTNLKASEVEHGDVGDFILLVGVQVGVVDRHGVVSVADIVAARVGGSSGNGDVGEQKGFVTMAAITFSVHAHIHGVETTLHEIGVAGPVRSAAVFAYSVQKGKSGEQKDDTNCCKDLMKQKTRPSLAHIL